MEIPGQAERLRIYVGANDTFASRPLIDVLLDRARQAGMAGATVLRGVAGFGESARVHRIELMLSHDLPILMEIVDTAEKIDGFLSEAQTMIGTGLITREPVQVVRYGATPSG